MTMHTKIWALGQAVSTALRSLRNDVTGSPTGSLTTLTTSDQSSIISAINEVVGSVSGKEPTFAAGTSAQYYRGDKTWQTLDKASVGLNNVNNTADANKPISTSTATALSGKATIVHTHAIADTTGLQAALDGKQAAGFYAAATHTHAQADVTGLAAALAAKEALLTTGTTAQYYRGDKTWVALDKAAVGLSNVDNTSDSNKPVSTATSTALSSKAASVHTHAQADVTGLVSALSGKEPIIAAGTTAQYLRGDKTWAAPVPDGDKVDIIVSGVGAVYSISDSAQQGKILAVANGIALF
jgi:Phage tail repeat like